LLEYLLHLIIFSTLVVLFVLLSLLLSLSLSLDHVCLILIFLKLVLQDASLNILERLTTSFFLSDAIVTYHINKHDASMDELLLLFKKNHNALVKLVFARFTIGEH